MSAAAEKPSEYLKRTCLICGCNTNQTINIYEPRSGPNIVELIQAKFKFQPLNEDKYLCFSCNNWLINWHSLQANNSNDAESPSGTFRSAQVNGGLAQDKRAANNSPAEKQNKQRATALCRPIAQVRPQQILLAAEEEASKNRHTQPLAGGGASFERINLTTTTISKKYAKHYYAKRHSSAYCPNRVYKAGVKKRLSACYVCKRPLVLRMRSNLRQISKTTKHNAKCRKCRRVCEWRSIYMRSLKLCKPPKTTTTTRSTRTAPQCLLVSNPQQHQPHYYQRQQQQQLKRPTVDGKIVAMLRRLGTTLSRDCPTIDNAQQLPPIMSPAKSKPTRWLRPLDADEILLNFETAISEVLPFAKQVDTTSVKTARRKLTYQMSTCEAQMVDDYQGLLKSLPIGLNVSLI